MASLGVGYKTACDVLMEISYHLIEAVVNTSVVSIVPGGYGDGGYGDNGYGDGAAYFIEPGDMTGFYVGAKVVVGWNSENAEVGVVLNMEESGFIVALENQHVAGEKILAPTFPTQQTTDPFFSQDEMLGYLARAQNEFLAQCFVFYQMSEQKLAYGQVLQPTPEDCVQLVRVSASRFFSQIASLTRVNGTVTLATQDAHGLRVNSTIYVENETASFIGVFKVTATPTANTFVYQQAGDDEVAQDGSVLYFSRLYETTQTELTMFVREWKNRYLDFPTCFFEDRAGIHRWGVDGKPSSNFPVKLLFASRDTTTLTLLDGFLVPDIMVHIVKYGALGYALTKEGVQSDPMRAAYCRDRFTRGMAAVNRYLRGFVADPRGEA